MEQVVKEKSKRGRKKKPVQEVQVKKRRGRKLAVDYYSTSACKNEMSKPSSIISNTILQLNVETINEDNFNLEAFNIEEHTKFKMEVEFKKLQEKENDTILEDYINAGSVGSLDDIYNNHVNNRKEQDNSFIKKLTGYYNGDNNLEQEKTSTFEEHEFKKESNENPLKSTLIETLDTLNMVNMKNLVVLRKLVGVEWPDRTSIKCWWCCNNFNTIPVGIPIRYIKKDDKYHVRGIYCSFACMYAESKKENIKNCLVREFYNRVTNASWNDTLSEAPPREVLQDFGGDLTITQFRELSKNKKLYKMIKHPMILREDIVNISDVEKMKNVHKKLTRDVYNSNNSSNLEIKDKPLQKTTIQTLLDIEYEDE